MEMKKLLALLGTSAVLLAACDEPEEESAGPDTEDVEEADEDTADAEEETTEDEEEPEEEEDSNGDLLAIGDSITVDDITMTITGAEFTDDRNEFADEEPDEVIAIHYTLENDSDDDYPYGADFDVYVDGSQANSYPNDNSIGSVSPGRSVDGVAHYGVTGEDIEVEWEPMFSFSDERGIWNITPE